MLGNTIDDELTRRRCQRSYGEYVAYANEGFVMTAFHRYLTAEIQEFIERPSTEAMSILLLAVPPRHGKAIVKDCPVWTPDGWKLHGELKVGDKLYHADGSIATVIQVHPDYTGPLWRVTTNTGESILCSGEHLWNVTYSDRGTKPTRLVTKTVSTQDIFNQNRYLLERAPFIAVNGSCDGNNTSLPIDPYVLGAWLGDGYSHNGYICGAVDDLLELWPDREIYVDGRGIGTVREMIDTSVLKTLELYKNKHIPVMYLTANREARLALLQGLLDTDGNISRSNCTIEICLANETLARDAYTLVRSLGYKAQFRERTTRCQTGATGRAWRVMFRPYDNDILFRLSRKQDILDLWSYEQKKRDISSRYYIDSVECIAPTCLANCISVDGDGTYLVGQDMIPTHNSFTITETLPSWYLGKYPHNDVIICGYEGTFAESFSRRNRDKFNEYAADIFHTAGNPNVQGVALWETADGGKCHAAGLKGGITGFGADLFIIDDPIKNKETAESETVIAKIHDEMGPSVQSRIHPGGKLIVIQTRWVENDVIGYIESNWGEYIWKSINLPCECEDPANDPLGRKLGESLMGPHLGDNNLPQRIRNDNLWLQSKKRLVCAADGMHTWNALYQGHPSAQDGNLFKPSWWQHYTRDVVGFDNFSYTCLSVDATFKGVETADMVAIELWGVCEERAYLFKLVNKRMGFVDTLQRTEEFPGIDQLLIEDKANGSAIIDSLRYEENIPPVVAINPNGGKYSRAQAVAPFVATRVCYVPDDFTDAECLEVESPDNTHLPPQQLFINQHTKFPFAKHDDMVDACDQALTRIIKLITGEEPAPTKRYIRFTHWYPDMWDDYEKLNEQEQIAYVQHYGAPEEWQDLA